MEDFLLNTLNGIKQWASKFWEKDEYTYSEYGMYDAGTQAVGKTIITPIHNGFKKVTLVINSCGTRSDWQWMYYRLPYTPAVRPEITWLGNYNGTDFRINLSNQQGYPAFGLVHLIWNGETYNEDKWSGQTVSFVIEYIAK